MRSDRQESYIKSKERGWEDLEIEFRRRPLWAEVAISPASDPTRAAGHEGKARRAVGGQVACWQGLWPPSRLATAAACRAKGTILEL